MSSKTLIWIGAAIGGFIGGYVPTLFGAGDISFSAIIGSMVGGLIGIWGAYKLTKIL
jgi:hypothetical protein